MARIILLIYFFAIIDLSSTQAVEMLAAKIKGQADNFRAAKEVAIEACKRILSQKADALKTEVIAFNSVYGMPPTPIETALVGVLLESNDHRTKTWFIIEVWRNVYAFDSSWKTLLYQGYSYLGKPLPMHYIRTDVMPAREDVLKFWKNICNSGFEDNKVPADWVFTDSLDVFLNDKAKLK